MAKALRCVLWLGVMVIILGAVSCNFSSTNGETGPEDVTATAESGDSTLSAVSPVPGVSPEPGGPIAPENTDGAEVILIPGGLFWMGSASTDEVADEDEMPPHAVTLDGFYIYTREVTNAMYADCVAAGACLAVNILESGPTTHYGVPGYDEYPIVGVDWNMADDYCAWAGGRLPTEAEWERASRGTESLTYPWGGEEPGCDRVNMLGCTIPPDTVAVGSYLLGNSPEGVWDMSGNVWEWVHDWYADDYYLFSPAVDPLGPYIYQDVHNPLKVARGGGLFSAPDKMRSAERVGLNPYRVYDDLGFRCVTPPGLDLPEEYIPTRDRHERIPESPDGGDHVDDPARGDWVSFGPMSASCPTTEGTMQVLISADSSVPGILWDVVVEGSTLSCTYDDVANLLNCYGPLPVNNDTLTRYRVDIHTSLPGGVYSGTIEKPTACTSFTPPSGTVAMDCPQDGRVNVTFQFVPQIRWTTIQLAGTDISCVPFSDNELRCSVPDLRMGDQYEFHLLGVDAAGQEYEWNPHLPVRADCPMAASAVDLNYSCVDGTPYINILYRPESLGIASVTADGVPLSCLAVAPNAKICTGLTSTLGTSVQVIACTSSGTCFTENLVVAGCSSDLPELVFLLEPGCLTLYGVPTPIVNLYYWPEHYMTVSASVGSTFVGCAQQASGWDACPGLLPEVQLPGSPGELVTLDFCMEGGACGSGTFVFPDCRVPTTGGSGWRVSAIGCHNTEMIYYQVDTGYEWLLPGVPFIYNNTDGVSTYACTVNPSVPGRVYCSGLRPATPNPLEMCIMEPGHTTYTCQTFPDYPAWVASLPSCTPEVPPYVPPPPPPLGCSDYTNAGDCKAAGCDWSGSYCFGTPSPAFSLAGNHGIYKIIQDLFTLGDALIDPGFGIFSLLGGK